MKKLTIFYDNWCPNCNRFVNFINKSDWLKLIKIKQLRNESQLLLYKGIDKELAKKQMASYTNKWHYGYESLYLTFLRIPIFWLLMPLFFLLKITGTGNYLYNEFAVKRKIIPLHCDSETCNN
jgi:predicted DCC family thiol-disulfide oxidoreductase YuxK